MDLRSTVHQVTEADHRLRLDRFLHKVRPDLGRHAIDRLLHSGHVQVEGKPRDAGYYLKRGDTVEIRPAPPMPPSEPHEILRSAHAIAVAKPPGLATNPVPSSPESLLSWLEGRCDHPPGLVHRLDRDTSGIVLFSLSPEGHRLLEDAFRFQAIRKTYLALVPGRVHPRRGMIDRPLLRAASGRMQIDARGWHARTEYRRLHTTDSCNLLEVRPHSGRTHQIRAHLAAIGHPIAGDPIYGDPHRTLGAPRLWLHAASLELPQALPARLELPQRIECPLWEDLVAHLRTLGVDLSHSAYLQRESGRDAIPK